MDMIGRSRIGREITAMPSSTDLAIAHIEANSGAGLLSHCNGVAKITKELVTRALKNNKLVSKEMRELMIETAETAGKLHDMGKLRLTKDQITYVVSRLEELDILDPKTLEIARCLEENSIWDLIHSGVWYAKNSIEKNMINLHALIGRIILETFNISGVIATAAQYHHSTSEEMQDLGWDSNLICQAVIFADIFQAMLLDKTRAYQENITMQKFWTEIATKDLDPELLAIFTEYVEEEIAIRQELKREAAKAKAIENFGDSIISGFSKALARTGTAVQQEVEQKLAITA